MEPEGSSPYSQEPATVPVLSQIDPVRAPPPPSSLSKIHFTVCVLVGNKHVYQLYGRCGILNFNIILIPYIVLTFCVPSMLTVCKQYKVSQLKYTFFFLCAFWPNKRPSSGYVQWWLLPSIWLLPLVSCSLVISLQMLWNKIKHIKID
jgi:hypothetical protein